MKKKIIGLVLIIILIGMGTAYYQFTKTHDDMSDLKTEVQIDAEQLFTNFSDDENKANQLYLGKIIEVSGHVYSIEEGEAGQHNILLMPEDGMFGVSCLTQATSDLSVSKGDQITIKGECSGYLSDVILVRCIILN